MKELGLAPNDIAALQKMEWAKLVAAGNAAVAKINPPMRGLVFGPPIGPGSSPRVGWSPTLDGQHHQCAVLLRRCAGDFEERADADRLGERRRQPDALPTPPKRSGTPPSQGIMAMPRRPR